MNNNLSFDEFGFYILDSSFFFSTFQIPYSETGRFLTSPEILNEIQDAMNKIRIQSLISADLLQIRSGEEKYKLILKEKLQNYDNLKRLSAPDQSLLILALNIKNKYPESKTIIVTDDYEIQNVAKILKIKFQSIRYKPIRKTRKYRLKCKVCGYGIKKDSDHCENCGNQTFYYKKQ
jgi:UPF0271 protein